jgi:hypothetical protein
MTHILEFAKPLSDDSVRRSCEKKIFKWAVAGAAMLALHSVQGARCRASISLPAVDIDPASASFSVLSNGTFGWAFTPTSDIAVTDLGFFDRNGNGLAIPHSVGIWDAITHHLLASATVPAGTTAPLQDNFRYVSIPQTLLTEGQSYVIGANNAQNNGHNEALALQATMTVNPSITFLGYQWIHSTTDPTFGDSLRFPTNAHFQNSAFGPNFHFTAATPEPWSALVWMALGCAGVGAGLHRQRRTGRATKPIALAPEAQPAPVFAEDLEANASPLATAAFAAAVRRRLV